MSYVKSGLEHPFKKRVGQLEQALGQTQAENVLNATFLKLACEHMGMDVEIFKKNSDGKPSTGPKGTGQAG